MTDASPIDGTDPVSVRFSVLVATVGRRSLGAALRSAWKQLVPGDELLVDFNQDGDLGSAGRNRLAAKATGTHLLFIDDDDSFANGALEKMRRFATDNPGRIGIFRMRTSAGELIWSRPIFEYGCVGTPTMVVPNVRGKLGTWKQTDKGCDWNFLEETVALQGSEPLFVDHVVAHLRLHGEFRSWIDKARFRLRLRSRLHGLF
jgi:Glycosyl transferase family 2